MAGAVILDIAKTVVSLWPILLVLLLGLGTSVLLFSGETKRKSQKFFGGILLVLILGIGAVRGYIAMQFPVEKVSTSIDIVRDGETLPLDLVLFRGEYLIVTQENRRTITFEEETGYNRHSLTYQTITREKEGTPPEVAVALKRKYAESLLLRSHFTRGTIALPQNMTKRIDISANEGKVTLQTKQLGTSSLDLQVANSYIEIALSCEEFSGTISVSGDARVFGKIVVYKECSYRGEGDYIKSLLDDVGADSEGDEQTIRMKVFGIPWGHLAVEMRTLHNN